MIAVAIAALLLAACGDDDDDAAGDGAAEPGATTATTAEGSDGTAADSGDGGVAAARENVEKYNEQPEGMPEIEPLSTTPPEGITVAFMVCPDPSCDDLSEYLSEPIAALGWELTTFPVSATDPASSFQQALDSGPDYLAQTGYDIAQIPQVYDQAKQLGIPIFTCYSTDVPAGEENGLYSDCLDAESTEAYGGALADWVIADSEGQANVVIVNLPAFPILLAGAESAAARFEENCPECTVDNLDLTIDDLTSGEVANKVITYLQSNPDITYIYEVYEGFGAFGVPEAIEASGFADAVKIVGQQGFAVQMQNVIDGKEDVWSTLPYPFAMWSMADAMARYSVDEWSLEAERLLATPPFYLVDTVEEAEELVDEPYGWPGPEGFEEDFKAAWKLTA